ncbi:MAG TPA: hypothetical protein VII40_09100 [Xanthobacteraceae bacterium]
MAEPIRRDERAADSANAEKDRRRLIVGAASNYRPEQLRPFVESLRASGYAGDVIIMLHFWNLPLRAYLRRNGIIPYPMWSTRRLHGPAATYRYQLYARVARENLGRYDEMMVTDTRDVLFQRHPFVDLTSSACHFYLEHPTRTVGEEPTNLRWAKQFLPPDQAAALSRHRISCNGIVLGGMAEMNAYLARMAADIRSVPIEERRLGAADASIHHRLVFLDGGVAGVVMENNVHVATMGLEPDATYVVADDGVVRTAEGHVPAILHQYDRVPAVQAALARRHAWFGPTK